MVSTEQILNRVKDIPPLPDVVFQILKLTQSPNSSARDLVEVMELDPGITAKVLRLCNSAYFGLPQKVTSLQTATVYLGMNEISNLVIIGCVNSIYNCPQPAYGLEKGDLWRHSVAVAVVAKRLAFECRYPDPNTAFTAGLLHDLGKIMLHEYVHRNIDDIENIMNTQEMILSEAEKKVLGFNHCEIGKLVAEKWNMPLSLQEAIQYHHAEKFEAEDSVVVALTHMANVICYNMQIGTHAPDSAQPLPLFQSALEHTNLTIDKLESLEESFFEDFEKATDLVKSEE